jgi:hypothetical protein
MASKVAYDTSSDALLRPAHNADFFKGWVPDVDNLNQDLLCAEMSRLAYAPEDVIRHSLAPIGFSAVEPIGGESLKERFGASGTQGFVAHRLRLTVLAFRGTESDKVEDLLSDGRTLDQKEWPQSEGCLVHCGFAGCWDPVSASVTRLLADRKGTLLITGHSLGAAVADADRHRDQDAARQAYRRTLTSAPLRDLADHAPINYVSAFAGRL